ncbi:hypothetical protein VTK73DRAFT_8172 [Phialemonium thermophilum]|uniref:Methyltransferase domain-containing protein n=1 Tax=Phialemonium thermophilum TaxID=223376 RepID=A0ABR3W9U3_9PEZI
MGASRSGHVEKRGRPTMPRNRGPPSSLSLVLPDPRRCGSTARSTGAEWIHRVNPAAVKDWNLYSRWYSGMYNPIIDVPSLRRSALSHTMWERMLDGSPARCLDRFAELGFDALPPTLKKSRKPIAILALGFGNGEWAFDVARLLPRAKVVGVDYQIPRWLIGPPNLLCMSANLDNSFCTFDQEHKNRYSVVHVRTVASRVRDLPSFLHKCYESLIPGGYLEIHEFGPLTADDGSLSGTCIEEVQRRIWQHVGAGEPTVPHTESWYTQRNCADPLARIGPLVHDLGFVDVTVSRIRCPIREDMVAPGVPDSALNGRDKKERDLARLYRKQFEEARVIDTQCRKALNAQPVFSEEQVAEAMAHVRSELDNPRINAYSPAYIIMACKPLEESRNAAPTNSSTSAVPFLSGILDVDPNSKGKGRALDNLD